MLNLYLLKQSDNTGYDTYDALVVCAADKAAACLIHPYSDGWEDPIGVWALRPENVQVTYLGQADSSIAAGIVLASFNAG